MAIKIDHTFIEINQTFTDLLNLKEEAGLEKLMFTFRERLRAIEQHPLPAVEEALSKNRHLLIEIFQFNKLAKDHIWSELGQTSKSIERSIEIVSVHEPKFRRKIKKLKLGTLLDFVDE